MKEITPKAMRCDDTLTCPALFDCGDTVLIIGRHVLAAAVGLADKVGSQEIVIEVPKGLLEGIAWEGTQ